MSIIIDGISKKFAKETEREVAALDKLSFGIEEHEFVSIVGPSGCGKTTLLKIVAGLVKPDTGQITFPGVEKAPSTVMVFQDHGLLPWLTVLENIGLGLELKGIPKAARRSQVLEFMFRLRLDGFENHYPHELSIGMRQRVALARAFLTNPDIMLMDEPFGALDAQTRLILQEELLHIWRVEQNTVLFVTHDIDEAILLSDRIIVLSDRPGKIQTIIQIPLGRPRELTLKDHPAFISIRQQIWKLLEPEVRRELKLA
jgi:ABC-type nitrate/sulfonate/bicarbonate transport system ATPase subunit